MEVADWGPMRVGNEPESSYPSIYHAAYQSAAEKSSQNLGLDPLDKAEVESHGFSVFGSVTVDVLLGTWSRDPRKMPAGKMALIVMLEGLEAMSLRLLTKVLNWTFEDVKNLCEEVKSELLTSGARGTVARKLLITCQSLIRTDGVLYLWLKGRVLVFDPCFEAI